MTHKDIAHIITSWLANDSSIETEAIDIADSRDWRAVRDYAVNLLTTARPESIAWYQLRSILNEYVDWRQVHADLKSDDDEDGPDIGERAVCKHCDLDIEYVGTDNHGWHDRGGNFYCPSGEPHEP